MCNIGSKKKFMCSRKNCGPEKEEMRYILTICLLLPAGCRSAITEHPRTSYDYTVGLSDRDKAIVMDLMYMGDPNIFKVKEDSIDVQLGLRRYSGTRIAIR